MPDNVDIALNREEFRVWLAENHANERECWLRVRRGRPSSNAETAHVWSKFKSPPPLYQRVWADNIQRVRSRPEEFDKWLNHLIDQTKKGCMYGDWDDFGRLSPGVQ